MVDVSVQNRNLFGVNFLLQLMNWRSSDQPMVGVCLASVAGICLDRFIGGSLFDGPRTFGLLSNVVWLVLAFVTLIIWRWAFLSRKRSAGWLLLLAVGFGMASWHHAQWRLLPSDHIGLAPLKFEDPEPVAIRCRVASVPESSPLPQASTLATIPLGVRTKFRARATHVRDRDEWVPASGKLMVRVNGHVLGLRVGDSIQMFGSLSPIPKPMNPGQHDLRLTARAERLFCRVDVSYPDCISLAPSSMEEELSVVQRAYAAFLMTIGEMRIAGLSSLDEFIGSPRNVLAGALLLGARDRLGPDRTEFFFHTGTIHLLAISGLHLGILTWFFFVLAKKSSFRKWAVTLLMIFSVTYCFLTGMREPVLRAAILVHVVCVGMIWRRNIVAYNALAAAAVLVLAIRPAALFRPGAQLSFLAVGTLIWLSLNYRPAEPSAVDKLIRRTRTWQGATVSAVREKVWQLTLAGLAVWLVTTPLVMLQFHLLSPIALVLNVVLALPIVVSLLSGFAVLLLGGLARPIAVASGGVCDQGLAFVEAVVKFGHDLPGAYFWVAGPHPAWCGVFYLVLALLVGVPQCRPTKRWAIALFCVWIALPPSVLLLGDVTNRMAGATSGKQEELRCTFLSVGHGTCVVIELPDDRVLLYDCGRMGVPETGVRIVSEFLWHRGISYLDGAILSHADADHYNIFPGLLERFAVGEVLSSHVMFDSTSPGVAVLRKAIDRSGAPIREIESGDLMRFGEATIEVLHPLAGGVRGSDNANSIVLEIRYQGKTILLPGDLESPGLDDVMAENPRDVDVVMAPHHGSMNSSPTEFTQWCTPEFVVISGGHDEELEAKQRELFLRMGRAAFHTASDGAVTVSIRRRELLVERFCDPR